MTQGQSSGRPNNQLVSRTTFRTNGKPPPSTNKTQYITLASWSQQHKGTGQMKTTRNRIIHKGSQRLKANRILDPAAIRRAHNTTHVLPRIFPRNTNAKSCKGATTIAQTPQQWRRVLFQSTSQDDLHYTYHPCATERHDNKPRTDQPCKWP
jgi:hypothetical protein